MDEAALLRFLLDAGRRGYAAGGTAVKIQEADHSTTIVLDDGKWRFHDNYFGGEPYGGREIVFLDGRPVWMAVYYGAYRPVGGRPLGGRSAQSVGVVVGRPSDRL